MSVNVLLGFEVGTGKRVEVPLAHTFVTGQTQLSGKTTTLRALVERSKRRALAFVTKRGETFPGRRIRPYLPREGSEPIPWLLVESILAAAVGERKLKWERSEIIRASKGARSLADVAANVERLGAKAKDGRSRDVYLLLGEYLQLVLPAMRALKAADVLELGPGLNVMDLAAHSLQVQSLVIRAALEHINRHEEKVLTVFPEAWEFAPREKNAPAKDAAIGLARKGAVLENFLLCDSQDIAGVDTVVRQAASVWILGVQRELNELKRTIETIPRGIKRPKPEDVAQLEIGEFFACWGRHAVKVYVLPSGVSELEGRAFALGRGPRPVLARRQVDDEFESVASIAKRTIPVIQSSELEQQFTRFVTKGRKAQDVVDHLAAYGPGLTFGELAIGELFVYADGGLQARPHRKVAVDRYETFVDARGRGNGTGTAEDYYRVERWEEGGEEMNATQERKLDQLVASVGELAAAIKGWAAIADTTAAAPLRNSEARAGNPDAGTPDKKEVEINVDDAVLDGLVERLLNRAAAGDPRVAAAIEVTVQRPEIRVKVERATISTTADTLQGRLALLVAEGFFDEAKEAGKAFAEVTRRGFRTAHPNVAKELQELARMGFLTRSNKWYTAVPDRKRHVVEA